MASGAEGRVARDGGHVGHPGHPPVQRQDEHADFRGDDQERALPAEPAGHREGALEARQQAGQHEGQTQARVQERAAREEDDDGPGGAREEGCESRAEQEGPQVLPGRAV